MIKAIKNGIKAILYLDKEPKLGVEMHNKVSLTKTYNTIERTINLGLSKSAFFR